MIYKYYAEPLWDYTPKEYEEENPDVLLVETDVIVLDRDENDVHVRVIHPAGYILSDGDYNRLEELVNEN